MFASTSFLNLAPFSIISVPRLSLIPCDVRPFVRIISLSTRISFKSLALASNSLSIFSNSILSAALDARVFIALENSLRSITIPLRDGFALSEASFTSPALSPKIARNSFSSGEGSLSPLGVIFPIRISPGSTRAPIRIIPLSSRSLVASSLTLGISEVSSSTPRLVSRTSNENSST